MTTSSHDHSQPGRAAQKAAMALVRALVADDRAAIRRAAIAGGCPACNAASVAAWWFTFAQALTGLPAPELARLVLAAVEATEHELRAAGN